MRGKNIFLETSHLIHSLINSSKKIHITSNFSHLVSVTILQNLLRLGSNILLARLLYPEAFGIVGIILSITFILTLSGDLGVRPFLIRNKNGGKSEYLDTVWTIQLFRGLVLCILLIFASETVSEFYHADELHLPLLVISAIFIFNGFESTAFIEAERNQRISKVLWIESCIYAFQVIVILLFSYYYRSHWPMVFGILLGAALKTAFSYILFENTIRKIRLNRSVAIELWNFAKFVIWTSVVTIVLSQLDRILIGRNFSLELMGVYSIAVNLTTAAGVFVFSYFDRVFFPEISKIIRENKHDLCYKYYQIQSKISPILAFCCAAGISLGPLLINILYDDRYQQAGHFVSLLMIGPLLLTICAGAERCMVASGYIEAELKCQIIRILWIFSTVFVAFQHFGIVGIILSFSTMNFLPKIYLIYRLKQIGVFSARHEFILILMACLGFLFGKGISLIFQFTM